MLEHLKPLTWPEVFDIWRSLEAHAPHWESIYRERGFSSWEEWRESTLVAAFRLKGLKWALYRITDPEAAIPTFRGGPFRSWIEKAYGGRSAPTPTFAELAAGAYAKNHGIIRKLSEHFPERTTIIGVRNEDGITVVEGTHRSCAAALAVAEGRHVPEVLIALAEYPYGRLPIAGQERKKDG